MFQYNCLIQWIVMYFFWFRVLLKIIWKPKNQENLGLLWERSRKTFFPLGKKMELGKIDSAYVYITCKETQNHLCGLSAQALEWLFMQSHTTYLETRITLLMWPKEVPVWIWEKNILILVHSGGINACLF